MSRQDDLDMVEASLIDLHKSIHKGWEQLIRDAGVELDRPAAALLKVLFMKNKPCRVLDVATYLGIEAPSVSRKAQELEEVGLIARLPDEHDGRVSNLQLTANGRAQLQRLQVARRAQMRRVFESWSQRDRHNLAALLTRFSRDLMEIKQTAHKKVGSQIGK